MKLILLVLLSAFAGSALGSEGCLHYLGTDVTLVGSVRLKTFYGPPGYGEDPKHDLLEHQALLFLTEPICVEENPTDEDESEENQTKITLIPINGENLTNFSGKSVAVQGVLIHANTAHHHTPVLIEIKNIKLQSESGPTSGSTRRPIRPAAR